MEKFFSAMALAFLLYASFGSFSQAQSNPNQNKTEYIGSICKANENCNISTFCCSEDKCVPGSVCYNGQKQASDYCDYNFECLSRCCSNNYCSHYRQCSKTCSLNSECDQGCCSLGFCTSANICMGRKPEGDFCDRSSECQSLSCI